MHKFKFTFLLPLSALMLLVYAFSNQLIVLPPLGKVLNPFLGVVQNETDYQLDSNNLIINDLGLRKEVKVYFDDRRIPHVFAENTADLYFAQGYLSAYMRLWQMDFVSYASAGRLSEIFYSGHLDYDRNQRRIGILDAAESSLLMMEKDSTTKRILNAYTSGVNAYIKQLDYKTMPFEYKFFDYKPESWTNLKTVLVMKSLAYTLSGYDEDYNMTNLMLTLGEKKFNSFFPGFQSTSKPVINKLYGPSNPSLIFQKKPDYLDYSFVNSKTIIAKNSYNPKLGSNSWAVSGKKTKSGFPILSTDPHLRLTLPSTWFEMQLTAPNVNVYGVSIPGIPAIILGFNENIAWGTTNGNDDVRDWYKLKISDDYKKYFYKGKWIPLSSKVERIKRKGQGIYLDTVYSTVHGPIVSTESFSEFYPNLKNCALKWTLHQPSNEILTFINLNKAKNYEDYSSAIKDFSCPIQNFTFASKDNTIAINHQGLLPDKWHGQGRFILDGTDSEHLYKKYIPMDSLPHEVNPERNFVFSANQHPTNPTYKYYYNGSFQENRANRIEELLSSSDKFDIDMMKRMQLDNINSLAVRALPILQHLVIKDSLTAPATLLLTKLELWKGDYSAENKSAKLYELWMENVRSATWDEYENYNFTSKKPDDETLLKYLRNDPFNACFDIVSTSELESAKMIVTSSFKNAVIEFEDSKKKIGPTWGDNNKITLWHLSGINTFSRANLESSGHPETINAKQKNWGPSWRMIVELGKRPKAYGVYPGGQSGNLGSKYFENFTNDWNAGKYYPLVFYMTVQEAKNESVNFFTLN